MLKCALVIIAQERDDDDPAAFFRDTFKVKGGAALLFDASLVIRIMKASAVTLSGRDYSSAKERNAAIVGFSHRIRIWKSKVGHMMGRYTDALFHLSNGKLSPPGLDTARDALHVGCELGIVNKSGAWFSYDGRRQQGENKAILSLNKNPERLLKLLDEIAEKLDQEEGRG